MVDVTRKALSGDLTSYDFLKALALILMVVDHAGRYFYPDIEVLQFIGRLSAPIWLFLIGYARTRGDLIRLLVAGVIVQISCVLTYKGAYNLDILFLFALSRYCLDSVMHFMLRSRLRFVAVCAALFLLIIPSSFVIMYGSAGFMWVVFGYLLRWRAENPAITRNLLVFYGLFVACSYVLSCVLLSPEFWAWKEGLLALCLLLVAGLSCFKPLSFPKLTQAMPRLVSGFIRLLGRRTLEFYVLHLLLFRFAAAALEVDGFGF